MGKQKRQRRKPHKDNPTGIPSAENYAKEEEENLTNEDSESALRQVFEQVQSVNIEEKLCGLQTLESMSCDKNFAVKIAKKGIAKIIGPLLVDKNTHIRACTASALRHIADNGKTEANTNLVKDDIMTPLCVLLKQYHTDWESKDENTKGKPTDESEAFVQAVTLLWTLCEYNEQAVKCCNKEDILSILTKFFDIDIYGIEIVTVVVQCLVSLSEDNATAVERLKNCEDILLNFLNIEANDKNVSEVICLRTAACGLLVNLISYTENTQIVCKVTTVLSDTLAIDSKELLSKLVSIVPHEKDNFSSNAKKRVQENRRILGAQQQALETLANLCSEDEGNENESDLENSDCETEEIEDVCMDDKLYTTAFSLPMEVVEIFNSCNIVKKVWEKATPPVDKGTIEILEQNVEGKAVLKQIHTLNCRAYLCLNNLMSCLEIETLGGIENIYRMWIGMGAVVSKDENENDVELLESATAAMRAATQRLSEAKTNIFNQLTVDDIKPLLNGERYMPNTNIRMNLIRILGAVGLIVMKIDTYEARMLIKFITEFLMDVGMNDPKVWVLAEVLDAIMDMFAEDTDMCDELAKNLKLVNSLPGYLSMFRKRLKQQRKTLGDHVAIVSTVNTNLPRFIKYKEKRLIK